MKKMLLLLVMFCSFAAYAQTYRYDFFYSLGEKGTGPALTPGSGCVYTYKNEALPFGLNRVVYKFDKGCGITFNDSLTNLLSAGSYTIEMVVLLDTITGYKKLIDFDYLGADKGFYNLGGKLNLYPNFTSTDSFIGAGTYQYMAITRDAATKQMYLFHNNKVAGGYNDNTDMYKYGVNKKLIFFRDDNGTGGEHTGGKVAMLSIANTSTDTTTMKGRFAALSTSLGITNNVKVSAISIHPNPTTDYLFIFTPRNSSYTMYNITGTALLKGELATGNNRISLAHLPQGVYVLKVDGTTHKIVKQ